MTKNSGQTSEATKVIVRAYPKIVYLYLTWLACVVCGLLQPDNMALASTDVDTAMSRVLASLNLKNLVDEQRKKEQPEEFVYHI